MDFPANTRDQRQWLKSIADEVSAFISFMFWMLMTKLALRAAARAKNETSRAQTDTREMFYAMKPYFTLPDDDEG